MRRDERPLARNRRETGWVYRSERRGANVTGGSAGPGFEREIDRGVRRERAHDRMARADLDALLLTGGPNPSYFADASGRQREAQEVVERITREAVDAIEPGVSVAEVARETEDALDALDVPTTARISRLAGRVGHSLGLQVTELPSLDIGSERAFERGWYSRSNPRSPPSTGRSTSRRTSS